METSTFPACDSSPRPDARELRRVAQEMRQTVLRMNRQAGSGHTGGSFSCAEILTVLYDYVLRLRPREPLWPERDRFILSKGHAAPMLYATMARRGFFDPSLLMTLRQAGSPLQGHPCRIHLPGVEMSTGPLGLGYSVGLGMALAALRRGEQWRVYVLGSDGELDEGQNWEAFLAMAKWRPPNLTLIIDRNRLQLDGPVEEIMPLGDLQAKLEAFGLTTLACDGHCPDSLMDALDRARSHPGVVAIVAETVKGKGVSFMEGNPAWHGQPIGPEDFARAMEELTRGMP